MRLPWQKGKSAFDDANDSSSTSLSGSPTIGRKGDALRSMSKSKANQSTGSYTIHDDHSIVDGSSDTGLAKRHGSKKSSNEDSKKSSDDSVAASPVAGRKTPSPLAAVRRESLEVPSAGVPRARRGSVDAGAVLRENARFIPVVAEAPIEVPPSPEVSKKDRDKKKKEKKKKDKRPRLVTFSMVEIDVLPDGTLATKQTNTHEPKKDEIPYHKRGKQEYKDKKKRLRLLRNASDPDQTTDDEDGSGEFDDSDEAFVVPTLNVLGTSDDDLTSTLTNSSQIPHIVNFKGPAPQHRVMNGGVRFSLINVYLARYTADIKGIFILTNARPHLIGLDNEKFDIRIKCSLLFDDYDSQINLTLNKMAPWLLDSVLQNHGSMDSPQSSPKGSHEEVFVKKSIDLADDNSPHLGFSFSMPVHTVFLPALYAMLTTMGMDTGQANFQVDGVIVLKLSVFKVKRKPIVIPPEQPEIRIPSFDSLSLDDSNSSATLTDLKKEREEEQPSVKPAAVPVVEEDPGTFWFNCNYDIAFEVEKDAHKVVVQSADLLHVGYGHK